MTHIDHIAINYEAGWPAEVFFSSILAEVRCITRQKYGRSDLSGSKDCCRIEPKHLIRLVWEDGYTLEWSELEGLNTAYENVRQVRC